MIDTVYVLAGIILVFGVLHVHLIKKYYKTKDKPSLYFGVAALFFVLPAAFGILIAIATALNNLPLARIFYQSSATTGILAYVFLNMFAVAMAKRDRGTRGIWVAFTSFLVIAFVVWASNPVIEGGISGTTEFTLTSMYKPPYGLPLIEVILTLMVVIGAYPIYLFFYIAKKAKETIIRIKSLLMGIGSFIGTVAYSIEVTAAISYVYMPIYRPLIFIGIFIMSFGYMMPKWLERKLVGHVLTSDESVESIVEKFFMPTVAQSIRGQSYAFSKSFGLNHQQMVGRKILLEFDAASNYEKPIHDFVSEVLANEEPIIVFTRSGSPIHSSLREHKAVRFFCLTQKTSVPKEVSESEMLVPSNDTSLMLNVFDKMLKAHTKGTINIIFDNLSDLVLSIGFEKTYRFMTYSAEMLFSPRITALFLVNEIAHDPKVLSSFRSLFSNQIFFGKAGMQTIKLPETDFLTAEMEKISAKNRDKQ